MFGADFELQICHSASTGPVYGAAGGENERMTVKKATPHPEREGREMYMWLLIARRRVVVGGGKKRRCEYVVFVVVVCRVPVWEWVC